jgi:hypothetical protein
MEKIKMPQPMGGGGCCGAVTIGSADVAKGRADHEFGSAAPANLSQFRSSRLRYGRAPELLMCVADKVCHKNMLRVS